MRPKPSAHRNTVTAGYTYLGQFIDHDLTLDITPLAQAHPRAEEIRNFRSPILDLDNVYGGGPTVSPFLYDLNYPPGHERFILGTTQANPAKPDATPAPEDLPRNQNGIALAGDPRQDENLIVAQLHVALLKLHNYVIGRLERQELQPVLADNATVFEQAQRLVTWHYQYVVRNDYLPKLVDPTLVDQIVATESSRAHARPFRLPIEFSAAAFRFGHSMVRDDYHLNEHHVLVALQTTPESPGLLDLTGAGGAACPHLPADFVVKWDRFFPFAGVSPGQLQNAEKIDARIASGLFALKRPTVKLFNKAAPDEPEKFVTPEEMLPVRTLLRGGRMGLPTGQSVAKFFHLKPVAVSIEVASAEEEQLINDHKLREETPLWFYILNEAESQGWDVNYANDQRLGPVGGRIVAGTLVQALFGDPISYLSVNPAWRPTITNANGQPAETISDLLRIVSPP